MALYDTPLARSQLRQAIDHGTNVWSKAKDPEMKELGRAILFLAQGVSMATEALDEMDEKLDAIVKGMKR